MIQRAHLLIYGMFCLNFNLKEIIREALGLSMIHFIVFLLVVGFMMSLKVTIYSVYALCSPVL